MPPVLAEMAKRERGREAIVDSAGSPLTQTYHLRSYRGRVAFRRLRTRAALVRKNKSMVATDDGAQVSPDRTGSFHEQS
jgi:hypothetical protein